MPGQYAQPKYPSMERQDFTQGQLGSFKFTPVNVPSSNTLDDTPILLAAQAMLRERLRRQTQPVTADNQTEFSPSVDSPQWVDDPLLSQSTSAFAFEATPPPSAVVKPDPEFFNTHIKPDLEESRLKLGPAAFRAAVDGNSPESSLSQIRSRAESSSTTIITSPITKKPDFISSPPPKKTIIITSPTSKKPVFPSASPKKSTFAMNPKALSFDPAAPPASPTSDAESMVMPSYKSIVHCLESEQERHQETKAKLAAVLARVKELESLSQKLHGHNLTLNASGRYLLDFIQRNQDKITETEKTSLVEAGFSVIDFAQDNDKTPVQNGVKGTNGNHGKTDPKVKITHDLTNGMNRKTKEVAKPQPVTPIKNRAADDPFVTNGHAQVNETTTTPEGDALVFNTDMLKDPTPDTPGSTRSIIMRKHFGADEAVKTSPTDTVTGVKGSGKTDVRSDMLASVTNMEEVTRTKTTDKNRGLASSDLTQSASSVGESDATSKTYQVKLQTADNPILELPAEFLAKYKKVNKKTDADSAESEPGDKPFEADANGEPSLSLDPSLRSLDADVSAPPSPALIDPPAFHELSIKWIANNENSIFDEEDMDAVFYGQPRGYGDEIFWQHPVRYLNYDSKNLFRTVMIDYIPADATYLDVVTEIHAGSLEKIELVPAIGKANNYQTARVVFNFELGASTTANYARDHGLKIRGQPVRVWQVLTQTYPKSREVEEFVFQDGFTRMLLINNVSPDALSCLPRKLDCFKTSIIDISRTFDGYDYIEFTSVATAVKAMKLLMHDERFLGTEYDFDEDPCDSAGQDGSAKTDW